MQPQIELSPVPLLIEIKGNKRLILMRNADFENILSGQASLDRELIQVENLTECIIAIVKWPYCEAKARMIRNKKLPLFTKTSKTIFLAQPKPIFIQPHSIDAIEDLTDKIKLLINQK